MTAVEVTAKRTSGESVSVNFDFGANLDETLNLFGEDIVFNHATGSIKIALQGWLRGQLDQKKTPAEIKEAIKTWKPGQRKQGKSPAEKLRDQMAKLTPEERKALLAEYGGKNK